MRYIELYIIIKVKKYPKSIIEVYGNYIDYQTILH